MAAIDKTYVNKEQLLEAIEWAKGVGKATLEDGSTFYPINFICGYNDIDDPTFWEKKREEYVLWNTPMWYDRWLWLWFSSWSSTNNILCYRNRYNY